MITERRRSWEAALKRREMQGKPQKKSTKERLKNFRGVTVRMQKIIEK